MKQDLRFYEFLSRIPFCRTYLGKILFIVLVGMNAPLIAVIVYLGTRSPISQMAATHVITIGFLGATLGAFGTLCALFALLSPVSLASKALRIYVDKQEVASIPTHFRDEVGRLMADVSTTLRHVDLRVHTLEEISQTDQLTGSYNRHAGEVHLKEDLARARRSKQALSLVMTDIDTFKEINDQFGHEAGDLCIQHVVTTIRRCLRQGDWIGRWGGDEFMIGLWNSDESVAKSVMERIRAYLHLHPAVLSDGQHIPLTITNGISTYNHQDDARMLFVKADSALLAAKSAGRNRTFVFGPDIPLITS